MYPFISAWVRSLLRRRKRAAPIVRPPRRTRLGVEVLEDRLAPATLQFLGATPNFMDFENWPDHVRPGGADDVVLANAAQLSNTSVTLGSSLQLHKLTIEAGFTLSVNDSLTADTVELRGGTIDGTGVVDITGNLDFGCGIMGGSGATLIQPGATATIGLTVNTSTGPFTDSRMLINLGDTTWDAPFTIHAGASVNNQGSLTIKNTDFSFDASTPLVNSGTLTFIGSNVTFNAPETYDSTIRIRDGGMNKVVTVNANVAIRDFTLGEDLTGAGTLTVTNRFAWESGKLTGTQVDGATQPVGSIIVPSTGTLDLSTLGFRKLAGRTLIVKGQRAGVAYGPTSPDLPPGVPPIPPVGPSGSSPLSYASILAWTDDLSVLSDIPFDNSAIRSSQISTNPAPFDPIAAAGALYRAMFGGVTGLGTDEDAIYRVMEGVRTQGDLSALTSAYARMYNGSDLHADLLSELSGDEWLRAEALYQRDWNRYVAVSIHEDMYGWRLTVDRDLIMRLLRDPRTDPATVKALYGAEYRLQTDLTATGDPIYTNADLVADLQAKLWANDFAQASALLNGNSAQADAAMVRDFAETTNAGFGVDVEPFADFFRSRTPQQIDAMRQAYSQTYGNGVADAMDRDLRNANWGFSNQNLGRLDKWNYIKSVLAGDRIAASVASLHSALYRPFPDKTAIWKTLTGLFADERAMVAQVYRQTYGTSLTAEFVQKLDPWYRPNWIFGKDLERTMRIFAHGGLSLAERFYYAMQGWGTDDPAVQAGLSELRNMTPEQIAQVDQQYQAVSGGESLRDGLSGDLAGRDWFEAQLALRGRPMTIQDELRLMNDRRDYERTGFVNQTTSGLLDALTWGAYTSPLNPLSEHAQRLDNSVQQANDLYVQAMNNGGLTEAQTTQLRELFQIADQNLETFRESRAAQADLIANMATTAVSLAIVVGTAGTAAPFVVTLVSATLASAATQASARFLIQGNAGLNYEVALTDLAVGGVTGATSVLAPFHFSTNYESSLARFLVGAARGALNGGSIGFFQGAATTAAQDSSWEQGIAMGFQTVMANGFQGALMGVAMGAPLEAFIAAVRPYELPSGVVEREGSTGRTRGANDEIGSDPRRNVTPETEPPPGAASAREAAAHLTEQQATREALLALQNRLGSSLDDAAISAVLRELGAGENITAEMIDQARRFMRGEATGTFGKPDWLRRLEQGQQFNAENRWRYDYNELYVHKSEGGGYWIVDSYNPTTGEIVSRKFTQLAEVNEATAIRNLNELATKYPPGTRVADVPSTPRSIFERFALPDGNVVLDGHMILEVPVQSLPIPQAVLDAATLEGITIRDVAGRVYNP